MDRSSQMFGHEAGKKGAAATTGEGGNVQLWGGESISTKEKYTIGGNNFHQKKEPDHRKAFSHN